MNQLSLKLYESDRHELLNEKDRGQVMEDLWQWIEKTVNRNNLS